MTTLATSSERLRAFSRSADYYDAVGISRQRNYDKEVADLAAIVGPLHGVPESHRRVVDWGCGTGEHVARWPQHGLSAIGFDPSPEMVVIARGKNLDVRTRAMCFVHGERHQVHVQTCLFAAFSYATAGGIDSPLDCVSSWARRDGLFIFDVVNYSAAACHLRPLDTFLSPDASFIRTLRKEFNHITSELWCEMSFDGEGIERFTEVHRLRAFTPHEITDALNRHGFDVLRLFDPESPSRAAPRPDSFYFMVVARKR